MRQIPALWIAVALLAITSLVNITLNRISTAHQNDGLRTVICSAEAAELSDPNTTPAQRQGAVNFWTRTLIEIHAKPCP